MAPTAPVPSSSQLAGNDKAQADALAVRAAEAALKDPRIAEVRSDACRRRLTAGQDGFETSKVRVAC